MLHPHNRRYYYTPSVPWRCRRLGVQECLLSPTGRRERHPQLPSRVIDILDEQQQRVFHTRGERADFVTLGHRWPAAQSDTVAPKLLRSNVESLSQAMPWEFLSKTFQHALIIARAAGFRCIWIDSHCVIQDDPDDLQRELQHMGDIFSNAALSIFALQPDKCLTRRISRHRCAFNHKPPTPRLQYQVQACSGQPDTFEVFARLAVDDDHKWSPKPPGSYERRGLLPGMNICRWSDMPDKQIGSSSCFSSLERKPTRQSLHGTTCS